MKVALLCESSADEAALWELLVAILGGRVERGEPPPLRTRGWPAIINVLPSVIRHLHYQTDSDSLVVLADGDGSEIHEACHQGTLPVGANCRYCRLQDVVVNVMRTLSPVAGRPPMRIAMAIAAPSVEAWYLFASTRSYTESTWREIQRQQPDAAIEILSLKRKVYGVDRPTLELETARAVEACRMIAGELHLLERAFPNGFGQLAAELRTWLGPT